MTDESGVSRRQALKYGGLAAAVPLLAGAQPARAASPGGDSLPKQVTQHVTQQAAPAQPALAADEAVDVRASRGGRGTGLRRQLQFPSVVDHVDHVDQTANDNQTANVI